MTINKEDIFIFFEAFMTRQGFEPLPKLWQYRKNFSEGFETIIFSISEYEDTSILEIHLGLRLKTIEHFVKQYLLGLPGFSKDAMTIVTSMGRLQGVKFRRYKLSNQNALVEAYEEIKRFLDPVGFSILEGWKGLQTLEEVYNKDPFDLTLVYNHYNKAIRGITLARFTNSEEYQELKQKYTELLKKKGTPEARLKRFSKLTNFLDYYSPN